MNNVLRNNQRDKEMASSYCDDMYATDLVYIRLPSYLPLYSINHQLSETHPHNRSQSKRISIIAFF